MSAKACTVLLFAAMALVAMPAICVAQPPEERGPRDRSLPRPKLFERLDKNGDGKISYDEVSASPRFDRDRFPRLDTDGDGFLSHRELRPGRPGPPGDRPRAPEQPFGKIDTNSDGELSFEEFIAMSRHLDRRRFDHLDADGDGVVTRDEMIRMRPGGPGGPRGMQGPGGPDGPPLRPGQRFQEIDTNGDGELSYKELSKTAPRMNKEIFARIDADGNGAVTRDEMARMRPRGRDGYGPPRGHRGPRGGRNRPRNHDEHSAWE